MDPVEGTREERTSEGESLPEGASPLQGIGLMTTVVERANMWHVLRQVERSRGNTGADGRGMSGLQSS